MHDESQDESASRRWPGGAPHGVLTHAAKASLGVRTVRETTRDTLGQRDKRDSTSRETGTGVTRRKAFRPSRVRLRKGPVLGGLGHTGQTPGSASRGAPPGPAALPAHGTGGAVPAATTRDVRRRNVRGKGCSSRRGAGGRSLEAPRGAGLRRANTKVSRLRREQHRGRLSQARVGRSWPERKQGHPPMSSNRANGIGPGRGAHDVPKDARHRVVRTRKTRVAGPRVRF